MNIRSYAAEMKYPQWGKWTFCGEEHDYGLLRENKPRDIAEKLVHQVFSNEEIATKKFMYKTHYYRGRNNLQDWVEVYYKDCIFEI